MKKVISVTEIDGEGLTALLGERVILWCARYFYFGTLTGVNDSCVLIESGAVVYETGPLTDKKFKDAQKLPGPWYVQICAIESFGKLEVTL